MNNFQISAIEVLDFKNAEKMLFASNGKGVKFYITLTGEYVVYVSEAIHVRTDNLKKAVDYFNTQCR
jgi:hypothetical protein